MYFKQYNALYLHPGKTAGTSIEQVIFPHSLDPHLPDQEFLFGLDSQLGIYLQHATAEQALKLLGSEVFERAFRFMTVRNPFDRIISVYNHSLGNFEQHFGGFRPFVLELPELVHQPSSIKGSHISPQYLFVTVQGNAVCDCIVRFENLEYGFNHVAHALNAQWSLENTRPHHTANSNIPIADYYDVEMIAAMNAAYSDDFRFFAYPTVPTGVLTKEVPFAPLS